MQGRVWDGAMIAAESNKSPTAGRNLRYIGVDALHVSTSSTSIGTLAPRPELLSSTAALDGVKKMVCRCRGEVWPSDWSREGALLSGPHAFGQLVEAGFVLAGRLELVVPAMRDAPSAACLNQSIR